MPKGRAAPLTPTVSSVTAHMIGFALTGRAGHGSLSAVAGTEGDQLLPRRGLQPRHGSRTSRRLGTSSRARCLTDSTHGALAECGWSQCRAGGQLCPAPHATSLPGGRSEAHASRERTQGCALSASPRTTTVMPAGVGRRCSSPQCRSLDHQTVRLLHYGSGTARCGSPRHDKEFLATPSVARIGRHPRIPRYRQPHEVFC